jgi:hypothetical protein
MRLAHQRRSAMSESNVPVDGDREDLGSLSIEDDPQGTVDPGELAGTANDEDSTTELHPTHSESDLED